MIGIKIICVGRLKEKFYTDAQKEFLKRLTGYCKPEIIELPESLLPPEPSEAEVLRALEKECAVIERKFTAGAYLIALCIEGCAIDSVGLSNLLADCAGRGESKLNIVIGGSFGLHQRIKERANVRLSMSKMTFPHNLARIILLEQVYRAFKIIEGGKYHK
ncbi:MAG: 23S rRNA (pseudouridine(1915)-N(3))-methyltransferase RlmH [Oscillospiraceae bacterium]|nr:23S rRNA (pseudouridine(1915)-N(3))-methyltransferase RlmH [Oscillospiraceae bacterium]